MTFNIAPGPQPQPVLAPLSEAAIFLVVTIRPGGEQEGRDLLSDIAGIQRAIGFKNDEARLTCVLGIGSDAWGRLFTGLRPAQLHPFQPVVGSQYTAPATPGDLLFHIRAHHMDMCFELASVLMNRLAGSVDVADEVHAFQYFDHRDLLGFVDGTESPKGAAAVAAVTIGNEDPTFSGGSYVIVQKYLHDLDAWNALPVEEQERPLGRHKLSDIELPDEDKPSNSHLTLNTIVDADGTQRQIVRDNMPFGTIGAGEYGTYYVAYAANPGVIEQMLDNMFIGKPPGNHDRILDFSTAVTGCLFYVPTADFLDDPDAVLASASTTTTDETTDNPSRADGSLSIGSLRRSGQS